REKYRRARSLFTELGLLSLVDNLGEEEAILAARRGDAQEAERLASAIVASSRGRSDLSGVASSTLALGEIRVRNGEPGRALDPLAESAALFERLARDYETFMARLWGALACHLAGRDAEATAGAAEALTLAARHGYGASIRRIAA